MAHSGTVAPCEGPMACRSAGDVARDCESEAAAALILVAGIVEPQERLEDVLAQMHGMVVPSSSTVI
jgi:hypothetical protein